MRRMPSTTSDRQMFERRVVGVVASVAAGGDAPRRRQTPTPAERQIIYSSQAARSGLMIFAAVGPTGHPKSS